MSGMVRFLINFLFTVTTLAGHAPMCLSGDAQQMLAIRPAREAGHCVEARDDNRLYCRLGCQSRANGVPPSLSFVPGGLPLGFWRPIMGGRPGVKYQEAICEHLDGQKVRNRKLRK